MASKAPLSSKRIAISKANTQMIGIVAAASVISIFCLVGAKAIWAQNTYQSKVVDAKEKAHRQLQANLEAADELVNSYKGFVALDPNIISGTKSGTGDKDGDNAKIILDALPGSYDFPALTSSLEKIMKDRNLKISNITGTDDEVNQQSKGSSPTPKEIIMPFSFTIDNANYQSVQELIATLQLSIRPILIDSLELSGATSDMSLTVNAHTYYQPEKNVEITKKVVK